MIEQNPPHFYIDEIAKQVRGKWVHLVEEEETEIRNT